MMEQRHHAATQNRFYPDMSNVNKNITAEAKRISPPTYIRVPNGGFKNYAALYGNGKHRFHQQ
jgi:hypothetical protein